MLKAYDYLEFLPGRSSLQTPEQYAQEQVMAKELVDELPKEAIPTAPRCFTCGSDDTELFFTKWKVPYFYCESCHSIFTPYNEAAIRAYQTNEHMIEFRTSQGYQSEASKYRKAFWEEVLEWIGFRSFRYLRKNEGLSILDYGNRYEGFIQTIRENPICGAYTLRGSILDCQEQRDDGAGQPDIVLYLDRLQQFANPGDELKTVYDELRPGGLLFISTRFGTGFDILTLKEHASVYPYEHINLPSAKGLCDMLRDIGYEVLDFSTPGQMDFGYVVNKEQFIPKDDFFIKHLVECTDKTVAQDFQRFLQKSGMSSHGRIVARKAASNG